MPSQSKVLIRRSRATDLRDLLTIENRCFRAHRFDKKDFAHHLRYRSAILLVAEVSRRVVGYIAGTIYHGSKNRIAKLHSMGVLPGWRRMRIGSALLKSFEKEVARRKSAAITLEVRKRNPSAQSLYSDFGYNVEAVLKNYYSPGSDGLRMRKNLDA
jgi:ribosomal-protein-alanine acetyltransferase